LALKEIYVFTITFVKDMEELIEPGVRPFLTSIGKRDDITKLHRRIFAHSMQQAL
jgi:hypothetical protein